jgi:hypothetical protein
MRTSGLALAAVLTLAPGIAVAQGSWGNVKSWKGTVTVEATDVQKREGAALTLSATMTYKATGEFTISDDMLPDGSHMQWPMPSVEAMSDPKRAETVYDRWQSQVVASYEANGLDESRNPFTVRCTADNQQPAKVGVTVQPTEPKYFFEVSPPKAQFKCSGESGRFPNGRLPQASFRLTGTRKEPGPVSGTQTFTVGTATIKVTYNMSPSK